MFYNAHFSFCHEVVVLRIFIADRLFDFHVILERYHFYVVELSGDEILKYFFVCCIQESRFLTCDMLL